MEPKELAIFDRSNVSILHAPPRDVRKRVILEELSAILTIPDGDRITRELGPRPHLRVSQDVKLGDSPTTVILGSAKTGGLIFETGPDAKSAPTLSRDAESTGVVKVGDASPVGSKGHFAFRSGTVNVPLEIGQSGTLSILKQAGAADDRRFALDINNGGTVVQENDLGLLGDLTITEPGWLSLKKSILTIGGKFLTTPGAVVAGNPTIATSFLNSGTTIVGFSPGRIAVEGDFEQTGSGSLVMELGGTTPVEEFDQLLVSGPVALDGTLFMSLIDGFRPTPEQRFEIVRGDTITGNFEHIVVEQWLPDLKFEIEYGQSSVVVRAVPVSTTSYPAWVAAQFTPAQLGDPLISDPDANPDDDLLPNSLEYVFGTDPSGVDVGAPITIRYNRSDQVELSFPWRTGALDAAFTLEQSEDMVIWESTEAYGVQMVAGPSELTEVTLSLDPSTVASGRAHYRLHVALESE